MVANLEQVIPERSKGWRPPVLRTVASEGTGIGEVADALEKLEFANKRRPIEFGNPSHASLFIVNPFRGSSAASWFSTHPPIRERVRRLRKMAVEMGAA